MLFSVANTVRICFGVIHPVAFFHFFIFFIELIKTENRV